MQEIEGDCIGRKFEDLTGRTFGKLTVLGVVPDSGGSGKHKRWNVRCECGREFTVKSCHLKSGATQYCSTCKGSGVRRVIQIDGTTTSSHTREELSQLQALPLSAKIARTKTLIRAWYEHYDGKVFLSFSGGKDSTVLLHIIREMFHDVPCVFFNTGLEYPEIVQFVKTFDNVELIKPKMTFKETVAKYGYPFISKEVSEIVYGARRYLKSVLAYTERLETTSESVDQPPPPLYSYRYKKLCGEESLLDYALKQNYNKAIDNQRVQLLMGIYNKSGKSDKVQVPNIHERSMFSCERYKFFLDAPFEIGNYCCTIMKKNPSRDYAKRTGRKPITAQMASESRLRTQIWLKQGCNAFDSKKPISNPLSFWTEQDILEYIYIYNVPIASVYGEVVSDIPVEDKDALLEMWLFDKDRPTFSTTGMQRTGCMFCMYGIRNEKEPNRLQKMKETHPKIYDFIMKPESEGGLGYKEKIDWINEHGDMNVKY